jgi:hypothetical protein
MDFSKNLGKRIIPGKKYGFFMNPRVSDYVAKYVVAETHRSCYVEVLKTHKMEAHTPYHVVRYEELDAIIFKRTLHSVVQVSIAILDCVESYIHPSGFFWQASKDEILALMAGKTTLDLSGCQMLSANQLRWIKHALPNVEFTLKFPNISNTDNEDVDVITRIFHQITISAIDAAQVKTIPPMVAISGIMTKMLKDPNRKKWYTESVVALSKLPVEVEACLIDLYIYFKIMMQKSTNNSNGTTYYESLKCLYAGIAEEDFNELLSVAVQYFLKKKHVLEQLIKEITASRQWYRIGDLIRIYFLASPKEYCLLGNRTVKMEIETELQRRQRRATVVGGTSNSFSDKTI